ncbi:hypothetical protein TNCV_373561 [Trichonephila clavipes]|nr:hypothetical protein TNCV_373561 [Trichonephila clavipes]
MVNLPYIFRNYFPSQTRSQFLLEAGPRTEWYEGNHPGAALLGTSSRRNETTLARLPSEQTRAQRLVEGFKVYPLSPNCNVTEAVPVHILTYIGCRKS